MRDGVRVVCVMRAFWAAVLVVMCASLVWGQELAYEAPTYPAPQKWEKGAGELTLAGCALFVPERSGKKVKVIAKALQERLKIISKADLQIKETAPTLDGVLVLCISKSAPDWKNLLKKLDLTPIPAAVADQGYAMNISADGAVLAAKFPLGLSYGAVSLMDIARRAGGGPLPALRITDWPDMPVRGFYGTHVFRPETVSREAIETAAAYAPLVKQRLLLLEMDTGIVKLDGHPEFHRPESWEKERYTEMVRLPLAEGIEVAPWVNMGKRIALRFGCPYAPLGDTDPTYLWAFGTVADELLEMLLSRHFCLGMNEEWHGKFGPWKRDRQQWQDAFSRFGEHLRRRGVSAMAIADYAAGPTARGYNVWNDRIKAHGLVQEHSDWLRAREEEIHGGPRDHWTFRVFPYPVKPDETMSDEEYARRIKALEEEHAQYVRSFPSDVTFFPKFSTTRGTAVDNMSRFGHRVMVFCPYINKRGGRDDGRIGAHTVKFLRQRKNRLNVLGAVGGRFGGGFYSLSGIVPVILVRSGGIFWNVASLPEQFYSPLERQFIAPPREEWNHSLNWRVVLDAEPQGTVAQAIERVKEPTWRWVHAREDLVARGFAAVPTLLGAMKAAEGELRQRFEGCISRIARDARGGIDRGTLDIRSVERYLSTGESDLRNIAAEAIGAAGVEGLKRVLAGLKQPDEAAACAWALAYARDKNCGAALCEALKAKGLPPEAKANAARAAGLLKVKEAVEPLVGVIETVSDPAAQREAAWALALLDARDRDKAVGTLLQSRDRVTRCRAVLALAVLRSKELLKTGHMLASDDANEAWLATWALFPAHVFDFHIASNRTGRNRAAGGGPGARYYDEAKGYYRLYYNIFDIEKAVPRDEALKVLAQAAGKQKDEKLKFLMERIPKEQQGFKYLQPSSSN